tara:strand:- start:325 stop:474 length:150 start_codon:yes stop_codon:yes gene_type:complete
VILINTETLYQTIAMIVVTAYSDAATGDFATAAATTAAAPPPSIHTWRR